MLTASAWTPRRRTAHLGRIRVTFEPDAQTEATRRFKGDAAAQAVLASTRKLSAMDAADFDAVFYPGGHGPLWDLAQDRASIALIEAMAAAGKPVAAVCHAPGVLHKVKSADGSPLVKGRKVTGFANTNKFLHPESRLCPIAKNPRKASRKACNRSSRC